MARLGDICEKITDYVASGSFAALKENVLITNEENYAIMVKTADFANGFSKGLTYTDKKGYDFLRNSNLFGGELILSNIGSIGKVFRVPCLNRPMTLASNTVMVKTATSELSDYLYYYFLSDAGYRNLMSISSGTSMLKFNKTELKNINIPLPSIGERKDIVDQLSRIYNLIFLRKQQIAKLDELVKARFVEMFGEQEYPIIEFGDVCDFLRNGANIKQTKGAGGYPITRIETLSNDRFNADRLGYADIHDLNKYSSYILQSGDILISHINSVAYLGRAVQYRGEVSGPVIHGMNLLCARIKEHDATYIEWYLKGNKAKTYISSITKKAVNQASITTSDLRKLPLMLPPIELQHQFASFVAQTDQQKSTIQHSLDKLELMKKALMQKYFG